MGKKHSYRIVGYKRTGGSQEVYSGTDWSMVSDEMPNNGKPMDAWNCTRMASSSRQQKRPYLNEDAAP